MHGFPLDISKKLLTNLIGGLRPTEPLQRPALSGVLIPDV
jgi:hypothetical protein